MEQAWKTELEAMEAKRPSGWARVVRPRVVVLPRFFTGRKLGAWVLYNLIFVTAAQAVCPPQVRRYVLGHEYGHIWCGHVGLQWAWLGSGLLYLIGFAVPAIFFIALVVQVAVLFSVANPAHITRREIHADAVAADLCGPCVALEGARWMADALGDRARPVRQVRLAELEERVRVHGI